MRSLGGELAQHVFIRELAAAECGVRQVVLAGGQTLKLAAESPAVATEWKQALTSAILTRFWTCLGWRSW